jgi:hypothetical protein
MRKKTVANTASTFIVARKATTNADAKPLATIKKRNQKTAKSKK